MAGARHAGRTRCRPAQNLPSAALAWCRCPTTPPVHRLRAVCHGGTDGRAARAVRDAPSWTCKRAPTSSSTWCSRTLFMNFRVVDEHGRQLGMGRNLGALKAELGGQARSAFQALAALKLMARSGRRPHGAGSKRATGRAMRGVTASHAHRRACQAGAASGGIPQRVGPRAAARRYTAGPLASCPS